MVAVSIVLQRSALIWVPTHVGDTTSNVRQEKYAVIWDLG